MISEKQLEQFTVIKVKKHICNEITGQTKRVIVILELEILNPGSQIRSKIGNPLQLGADGKLVPTAGSQFTNSDAGAGSKSPMASESKSIIDVDNPDPNEVNVKLVKSLSKLEESLECPVCYKIPRDLPIPCCVAGHIVCQPCRSRVTDCPTCRGRLESNTSSLAASQIMLVNHKCKFSFFGCDVKMKLDGIVVHEKSCPERTVICPYGKCKEEVQLKKFPEHARFRKCGYKVSRKYGIEGAFIKLNLLRGTEFNKARDHGWKLENFQTDNLTFYFSFKYRVGK